MSKDILFPEAEPRYVLELDCLAFPAGVDGKPVECLVSLELLWTRFGAREPSEQAVRQAYLEHRAEIQNIARNHIEYGWIDEENRLFLGTRFTRLTVTFGERLLDHADLRALAEAAHGMLAKIIGPNAEEVIVEWDGWGGESGPKEAGLCVRIIDPSVPHSVKAVFENKEWEQPTAFRLILAGIWSSILRTRSRKLFLKSG